MFPITHAPAHVHVTDFANMAEYQYIRELRARLEGRLHQKPLMNAGPPLSTVRNAAAEAYRKFLEHYLAGKKEPPYFLPLFSS